MANLLAPGARNCHPGVCRRYNGPPHESYLRTLRPFIALRGVRQFFSRHDALAWDTLLSDVR
jgi:hypothetical protein